MAVDGGHDKTHHPHEGSTQTANKETALSWSAASRTAAACLATAAILSSSLPAGAGLVGGDLGSSLMPGRGGAPVNAMMLVADEGELASADGRADVTQIISELRKADRADSVLNSMVKINDAVDSDEDGLLENPFAKEVCVRCLCVCMVLSCVFKVKCRVVENHTVSSCRGYDGSYHGASEGGQDTQNLSKFGVKMPLSPSVPDIFDRCGFVDLGCKPGCP